MSLCHVLVISQYFKLFHGYSIHYGYMYVIIDYDSLSSFGS